jgi:hypothetical protein
MEQVPSQVVELEGFFWPGIGDLWCSERCYPMGLSP